MTKVTKHRTQIYLSEQEYQYLRRQAEEKGSIAKVIRDLIDEKMKAPENYKNDPFYKWAMRPVASGTRDAAGHHGGQSDNRGKEQK